MGLLSPSEVGRRIRVARDRLGLDQSQLAERLGKPASQGLISNWEQGKAYPSRRYWARLAGALGIRAEELIVDDADDKAAG
jgi:transcriptional regulator with XRE-family HTH domain